MSERRNETPSAEATRKAALVAAIVASSGIKAADAEKIAYADLVDIAAGICPAGHC